MILLISNCQTIVDIQLYVAYVHCPASIISYVLCISTCVLQETFLFCIYYLSFVFWILALSYFKVFIQNQLPIIFTVKSHRSSWQISERAKRKWACKRNWFLAAKKMVLFSCNIFDLTTKNCSLWQDDEVKDHYMTSSFWSLAGWPTSDNGFEKWHEIIVTLITHPLLDSARSV
jgi:hypothetical protein